MLIAISKSEEFVEHGSKKKKRQQSAKLSWTIQLVTDRLSGSGESEVRLGRMDAEGEERRSGGEIWVDKVQLLLENERKRGWDDMRQEIS